LWSAATQWQEVPPACSPSRRVVCLAVPADRGRPRPSRQGTPPKPLLLDDGKLLRSDGPALSSWESGAWVTGQCPRVIGSKKTTDRGCRSLVDAGTGRTGRPSPKPKSRRPRGGGGQPICSAVTFWPVDASGGGTEERLARLRPCNSGGRKTGNKTNTAAHIHSTRSLRRTFVSRGRLAVIGLITRTIHEQDNLPD